MLIQQYCFHYWDVNSPPKSDTMQQHFEAIILMYGASFGGLVSHIQSRIEAPFEWDDGNEKNYCGSGLDEEKKTAIAS